MQIIATFDSMNIPEKDIQNFVFIEMADSDTASDVFSNKRFRKALNLRVNQPGQKGVGVNIPGSTLIQNSLPAGNNVGIGYGKNEEKGKLYYFNYNDQGNHGIYVLDIITKSVTPVLINKTDTNGVDILRFSIDFLINHVDIIQDNLIYWVDGLNKARKFNIKKAIDKSPSGYGSVIIEDYITAYKKTGIFSATVDYFTDLTRTSNYLYGLQFKFTYRFYYDDNEISNWADWSEVPLPPNESFLGINAITFDNNCIQVTIETGSKIVTKIEIAVKISSLDWVGCAMLNKLELGISDNSIYTYSFYNDGSYWGLDQLLVARAYSYMPRIPFTQSFVDTAMTYGHFEEGFPVVQINAKVDITFTPFYLPSGTVSQLNNPLLTATLSSTDHHGGLFNSWYTTTTHFEVGEDVKKGNIFSIVSHGGNALAEPGSRPVAGGHAQNFNYTADIGDDASTVASRIKQYLRNIDAVGTGTITSESIDISGNVSFDFTVEAHEGRQPITFTTSVTPVNYSTLLDNGLSLNTIKQGSIIKYAVVYDDDDDKTSNGYTANELIAKTPFETEVLLGQTTPVGLQKPIHTISIMNQPPVWAKYWRLVRTEGMTGFIQMLIQQVNTVEVANVDTYLDLVVGSLFTYQKIHPETVLVYDFERGDRLRLISKYDPDTFVPTYYTPFFETEVLSYSINEQIPINADIRSTIGTPSANVTPSDGVKVGYVGKNIIIEGTERTIVSISGADYVLDEPITLAQATSATLYTSSNYIIVDRRGVLRIKKPTGFDVADFTKVEIYHPDKNSNLNDYQNFFDFQQKFPVLNWGQPNRSHAGNIQNQDGTNATTLVSTPAVVQVINGNSYVRNRALPSSNANPNPQVIIDRVADPNYSDFYESNLYNSGRIFPQDRGYGVVKFGSRERFSNNYIEDTQVNGLNDFKNEDRKDYNDPHGDITLSRYRRGYLFLFKQLRTAWTPVGKKIITDNQGNQLLATSDKLLNELEYALWEGGIGDNGESWIENGNSQYFASTNSGVFIRIAQDGSIPVSQLYFYDKRAREILADVSKYKLRIYGGFDKKNDEALWSHRPFLSYLFNNEFTAGDWETLTAGYPDGTTWAITQQPANSTATIVDGLIQITGTSTLGNDLFKFQGTLPDSSLTPIINFCFTVIPNNNRPTKWVGKSGTEYCEVVSVPEFDLTVNITEHANPYSDANVLINLNGVLYQRLTSGGTFHFTPHSGHPILAAGFSERPATGASPTKTMSVIVNGSTVYGPTTGPNDPTSPDLTWSGYTPAEGDVIVVNESSFATAFDPAATGILVVDIFNDTTLNLTGYIATPGATIPYNQPCYTGNNFVGSSGAPASCWVLASDLDASPPPLWRFEFNVAQLMSLYPSETVFDFIINGRGASAGSVNGQYNLKGADAGQMTMAGSPGSYLPSTSGTTNIGIVTYSGKAYGAGANGTYGIAVGATILHFSYDVASKVMTLL